MDITTNMARPVLSKWVIRYDEVYGMPQFIQGTLIGDFLGFKNGSQIVVGDLESIDFKNRTVKTNGGVTYSIVGNGRRMILMPEEQAHSIISMMKENADYDENE